MLIGEYQHSVDVKGRVFVPAKLREGLGETFIVTKGINHCLFAYSLTEWDAFAQKLRTLPTTDQAAQAFLRLLFAGACECQTDKQGRVLLPQNLREFAQLEKEVVITGAFTRAEIWSSANWAAYNEQAIDQYDAILEKMASQFGI